MAVLETHPSPSGSPTSPRASTASAASTAQLIPRPAHRALVSAHRAAASEYGLVDNSTEALHAAVTSAAEFVEFDVGVTADGVMVLHHDFLVRTPGRRRYRPITSLTFDELTECLGRRPATYTEALVLIARAGKAAHVDLKFTSPRYDDPQQTLEASAAAEALDVMGDPSLFIVATTEEKSVASVRCWSSSRGVAPLVGLSIGGLVAPTRPGTAVRGPSPRDAHPTVRVDRCGANFVAVYRRLADLSVLRWAARRGVPALVWTVDDARSLNRYLGDGRVWMVTTNHPGRSGCDAVA